MIEGLAVLTAIFAVGFAVGFSVRSWISHRRRARLRRARAAADLSMGGI